MEKPEKVFFLPNWGGVVSTPKSNYFWFFLGDFFISLKCSETLKTNN